MTITRRDHGRGHSYYIDGAKVPGVTTILDAALPKPALINWAGRATAEYAVDNWDDLSELAISERLAKLNGARFEQRDEAARRGTEVHRLAESLVRGEQVDVPDEIAGHVDAYVRWLDAWDPTPVAVEVVVANRTVGYCGTADLVADLGGTRWLLDLKTARGVYGEVALQCCAYARAETWLDEADNVLELPMSDLGIERVGVVHIRSDAAELRPLEVGDEVWQTFRHLRWLARRIDDIDEWLGRPISPLRAVS